MTEGRIRAVEFYSGIGGLHAALLRSSVSGEVLRAFDWDQSACKVYEAFHNQQKVQKVDISSLSAPLLASYNAALWLMSPSCQPYTVLNPDAKGAKDPRAKSFIHLMETVLPELVAIGKQPTHLLVENVAGFETSTTRQSLLQTLDRLGYTTIELLLTPLQYHIPNSRLRYYLLARPKSLPFAHVDLHTQGRLWRHIPGQGEDWIDPRFEADLNQLTTIRCLGDFLNDDNSEDLDSALAIPDRVLEKWGRLFDIVSPSQRRSCCFTRGYTKLVERAGSVLQMNEELHTGTVFDTFLEAQAREEPDAVEHLRHLRLRYFSPTELLRIFGFNPPRGGPPETAVYRWPADVSQKTQYKLIGNSVNICVVTELINYLFAIYSVVSLRFDSFRQLFRYGSVRKTC